MSQRITGILLIAVSAAFAQQIDWTAGTQKDNDDRQEERAKWFYNQRRFPNATIPAGARRRAILEIQRIDAAARAGRQQARSAAQGNVPFALTTDSTNWKLIGPKPTDPGLSNTSGRINAVAIDPRDSNVVYIGAAEGGVWKTIDGGKNWAPLTDDQPSLANGGIALDPQNPDIVYVGTGEENFVQDAYYGAGILKSTDGGNTWTNIVGPFLNDYIGAIAVHPQNSDIIVCASSVGIWQSKDAGQTWTRTLTGVGISVVFEPNNGDSVWATLGLYSGSSRNGVYHSTNGGATWTLSNGTGTGATGCEHDGEDGTGAGAVVSSDHVSSSRPDDQ
jgi:photosystem II stability/assembly factor-like uncharacterized protein